MIGLELDIGELHTNQHQPAPVTLTPCRGEFEFVGPPHRPITGNAASRPVTPDHDSLVEQLQIILPTGIPRQFQRPVFEFSGAPEIIENQARKDHSDDVESYRQQFSTADNEELPSTSPVTALGR